MKTSKRIHKLSVAGFHEASKMLSAREAMVLSVIKLAGAAGITSRRVSELLGFTDTGCVRPRVTSLKDAFLIEEVGDVKCPVTKITVSLFAATSEERRLELVNAWVASLVNYGGES